MQNRNGSWVWTGRFWFSTEPGWGTLSGGDLGTSFTYRTPVTEELAKHMAPTAGMTVIVVTVTVLVSVPLGILCAVYKDRLLDQVMRVCSFVGNFAAVFPDFHFIFMAFLYAAGVV